MYSGAISLFRSSVARLYTEFRIAIKGTLANTEYFVIRLDKDVNFAGHTQIYAVGWIVDDVPSQQKSFEMVNRAGPFRMEDYYEIIKFAKLVYLFNPEKDWVARDKCEPASLQKFYGGTLQEFIDFSNGKSWLSPGYGKDTEKSLCDCGAKTAHGIADDAAGHSFWCKTREVYGNH
jgi:hypothetical protein